MIFEVSYLYRDASNYKQYESVVLEVPSANSVEEVESLILGRFADFQVWPDVVHFRPEDLGWPTAYFDDHDEAGDDVGLHEVVAIQMKLGKTRALYEVSLASFEVWVDRAAIPWRAIKLHLADVMDKARSLWPQALKGLPMADVHKQVLNAHW